jgi:4-amino-4-deoxy-L-arabinose transferase-like glycosyltransferase
MKKIFLIKNPYLFFLPFLIFYIILVVIFPTTGTDGDESRYLIYARYMIDGTLPLTDLNFDHLGNGPGYSIILIPFVALNVSLIWIGILNAFLFYLSIVLLFKSAKNFVTAKTAIIISLFWGLYINSYELIGKILPETFASFLICLLIYFLVNSFNQNKSNKYIYLAGFTIGFIALTKPIFGYVLTCMLIFVLIFLIFKFHNKNYRTSLFILAIAFATTVPYLIHTYKETGKTFYWSSLGGNNFYWNTTPDPNEYGNWFPNPGLPVDPATKHTYISDFQERIRVSHFENFNEINKYKGVQQDEVFKEIAINNIEKHPLKFIQNCVSNLTRIVFNFPYSYKLQNPSTLIRLPFNGILIILLLVCLIPSLRNWNKINYAVRFSFLFSLIYLGGSIWGSAETRMFTLIVPVILLWVSYIFERSFKINLRFI